MNDKQIEHDVPTTEASLPSGSNAMLVKRRDEKDLAELLFEYEHGRRTFARHLNRESGLLEEPALPLE
jgi:hypothetical protein